MSRLLQHSRWCNDQNVIEQYDLLLLEAFACVTLPLLREEFITLYIYHGYHLGHKTLNKYAMAVWVSWWNVSQREDGFPSGGDIPSGYPHCHGIFVLLYRTNPNLVKYQWKQQDDWWLTHSPLGVTSENGGHFAGGHDGMANLCKPITAYDFHVRYNNI